MSDKKHRIEPEEREIMQDVGMFPDLVGVCTCSMCDSPCRLCGVPREGGDPLLKSITSNRFTLKILPYEDDKGVIIRLCNPCVRRIMIFGTMEK